MELLLIHLKNAKKKTQIHQNVCSNFFQSMKKNAIVQVTLVYFKVLVHNLHKKSTIILNLFYLYLLNNIGKTFFCIWKVLQILYLLISLHPYNQITF